MNQIVLCPICNETMDTCQFESHMVLKHPDYNSLWFPAINKEKETGSEKEGDK